MGYIDLPKEDVNGDDTRSRLAELGMKFLARNAETEMDGDRTSYTVHLPEHIRVGECIPNVRMDFVDAASRLVFSSVICDAPEGGQRLCLVFPD